MLNGRSIPNNINSLSNPRIHPLSHPHPPPPPRRNPTFTNSHSSTTLVDRRSSQRYLRGQLYFSLQSLPCLLSSIRGLLTIPHDLDKPSMKPCFPTCSRMTLIRKDSSTATNHAYLQQVYLYP